MLCVKDYRSSANRPRLAYPLNRFIEPDFELTKTNKKPQPILIKLHKYVFLVLKHPEVWIRQQRKSFSQIHSWEGDLFKRVVFSRAYGNSSYCGWKAKHFLWNEAIFHNLVFCHHINKFSFVSIRFQYFLFYYEFWLKFKNRAIPILWNGSSSPTVSWVFTGRKLVSLLFPLLIILHSSLIISNEFSSNTRAISSSAI